MFLNASPRDDFRAAEIIAQNAAAANQGSRASFRATEIATQNAASSKPTRLLAYGVGAFLIYHFMLKGKK
jgi:hypothetical protein